MAWFFADHAFAARFTSLLQLLPAWFAFGLVISPDRVIESLQFLIPIGRFGSLIWLVAAGFLLQNSSPAR